MSQPLHHAEPAEERLTAFYARVTREESAKSSIPNQTAAFVSLAKTEGWTTRHFVEADPVHGDWEASRRPALQDLVDAVGVDAAVAVEQHRAGHSNVIEPNRPVVDA